MNVLTPLLIAVVPVLLYLGICALIAVRTSRPVQPGPPTLELGPEPPAVVNLLAHGGDLTEDAAEATLLDLAARRILELRGLGPDPRQTTVHLRAPAPADVSEYDRLVLDHVTERSVGGVVPLTALGFADGGRARDWVAELRVAVAADAKERGLTGYRMSGGNAVALVFSSVPAVVMCFFGTALIGLRPGDDSTLLPRFIGGGCIAFVVWIALVFTGMWLSRRGLTPLGRQRAAYWLGVRDWLAAHPNFADLPPAATAVWDRYLAYGAALGSTTVASKVIDLGLAGRRRPWSSYGGRWRRVDVRPLRAWARLRSRPGVMAALAVALLATGAAVVLLVPRRFGPVAAVPALAGAYLLVRLLIDAFRTAEVTGQVLWTDLRDTLVGSLVRRRAQVALDGGGDRTRPWIAARAAAVDVEPGDLVRATVRPWSRRVVRLAVLESRRRGPRHVRSEPQVAAPPWPELLPGYVVGPALDRPVTLSVAGPGVADYLSTVDGSLLVRVEVAGADRSPPTGWRLDGVGYEAYAGPGWAHARSGPTGVVVTSWPPVDPGAPARLLPVVVDRLAALLTTQRPEPRAPGGRLQ
jgi:hypothetical protein